MNNVVLIGRLTRDVEVKYTPNTQTAVARFTLAVDRQSKEKEADFISIVCFGRTAELAERYLGKGRQVAIQGRIQTSNYKNKQGNTVYVTEVVADRVEFIGKKDDIVKTETVDADMSKDRDDYDSGYDNGGFSTVEEDIPF